MAQTFGHIKLSGSTDGKGIKVVATATAGTLVHTAVSGTTDQDYPVLVANNEHTVGVTLTIEWGGVAVPDDTTTFELAAKSGPVPIAVGDKMIQNGLVIRAFCNVANVVMIRGGVFTVRGAL